MKLGKAGFSVYPTEGCALGKRAQHLLLFSSLQISVPTGRLPFAALSSLRLRYSPRQTAQLLPGKKGPLVNQSPVHTVCGGRIHPESEQLPLMVLGVWVHESLLKKLPFLDTFRMQNYQFPRVLRRKSKVLPYYGLGVGGEGAVWLCAVTVDLP